MDCDDFHFFSAGLDLLAHVNVVLALVDPSGVVVAWKVIKPVIPSTRQTRVRE